MHLVLPLAGRGLRFRPHSLARPKCLFRLAGDTVLGHVLARLAGLPISRTSLVVGPDGGAIAEWWRSAMAAGGGAHRGLRPGEATFHTQAEPGGQSQALSLLGDSLRGETLIVFADTLFEVDWRPVLSPAPGWDAHLFVRAVDDPSALGVAVVDPSGRVTRLVEKPREPVSDLAVMGLYHLRRGEALASAVAAQLADGTSAGGEHYLAGALQRLIDAGHRVTALPAAVWEECGRPEDVFPAHRYLLSRSWEGGTLPGEPASLRDPAELAGRFPGCRFLPPVAIAPDARLTDSVIGPNVVIGSGATISGSRVGPLVMVEPGVTVEASTVGPAVTLGASSHVRGSILADTVVGIGARVEGGDVERSLLGWGSMARDSYGNINLGDRDASDGQGKLWPAIGADGPSTTGGT